jgi:hypothetical protein
MSACCDTHHFCKPIVTQNVYNLLQTRGLETELKHISKKTRSDLLFLIRCRRTSDGKHHDRKPESGSVFATEKDIRSLLSAKKFDAVERLSRMAEQLEQIC